MFSVRIKPMNEETLISFLTRLASENGTKMLSIWFNNSRSMINPQKGDAHLLELTPEAFLNLEELSKATEVPKEQLIAMTFHHVFQKFCLPGENSRSRILRGMIREELHYCPLCIQEKAYVRIQWKINGIDTCLKHEVEFSKNCSDCGKIIKLMDIQNIEFCPYCNHELKNGPTEFYNLSIEEQSQNRLQEVIWRQLLLNGGAYLNPSEVATRLLYLLNRENIIFKKGIVRRNTDIIKIYLPYLLQLARDTFQKKRSVHIKTLLDVMKLCNIDYEYFAKLAVPDDFKHSLSVSKKQNAFENSGCIAPWCVFYRKTESLLSTGTKTKRRSDGSLFFNYVACTACGCRFAFNNERNMVEQDSFIRGYNTLKNLLNETGGIETLQEIRRPANFNRDQWWGVTAYFSTRSVFSDPEELDDGLIAAFVQYIKVNANMNNVCKWKCWSSYRHYLQYRYSLEVMNALVFSKRKAPARHNIKSYEEEVISLCGKLMKNNQDISVEKIASLVKVSSATLRAWGFHLFIKEKKGEQRRSRLEQKKELLIKKVDLFFQQNANNRILSKDIYQSIGISQTYLNTVAPDVNDYIRKKKLHFLNDRV